MCEIVSHRNTTVVWWDTDTATAINSSPLYRDMMQLLINFVFNLEF
jgi:hypothetical protein